VSEGQEPVAAAQALAAVPMFAGLDPVDLAKLAGVLEERWFDAGSIVFEAGGEGDGLYIMREGVAERRVSGSAIDRIVPYESFGQLSLLTDEPRSATVVAIRDSVLVRLGKAQFQRLLDLGLTDAFRLFEQPPKSWSWWDYRNLAFRKNQGLRIDHILVSEALRPEVSACTIDKTPRRNERPSDHAPVVVTLGASAG
jgi:hypothetical protein